MIPGDTPLKIGKYSFNSRLFVGTGKYETFEQMRQAVDASESECVTVAVRRVNMGIGESLLDYLDTERITLLPNTAGCFNADDAVRTARLAREALDSDLVKLEVLADKTTLLPDPLATLEAAKTLVDDGFTVLAYTNDDPIIARHLEDIGVAAVMPLGAPIGSGLGILNPRNIIAIKRAASVPIIVDAGVGTASDVTVAFELGIDGVLLNTGIAAASHPVVMALAMKHAWIAGRAAWLAGRMPARELAVPSSPTTDLIAPSGDASS
ncbi:MAG: thiazole synthase [Pseudohongiellaceae bacterium]|jgi:thiazole synthase